MRYYFADNEKLIKGKGLLNSVINKLPFELHIPGYNFCGPGTKLEKRLERGDTGINALDEACKEHDIAYSNYKELSDRHKADKVLVDKAWKRVRAPDASWKEKLAGLITSGVIKSKIKLGMGGRNNNKLSNKFKNNLQLLSASQKNNTIRQGKRLMQQSVTVMENYLKKMRTLLEKMNESNSVQVEKHHQKRSPLSEKNQKNKIKKIENESNIENYHEKKIKQKMTTSKAGKKRKHESTNKNESNIENYHEKKIKQKMTTSKAGKKRKHESTNISKNNKKRKLSEKEMELDLLTQQERPIKSFKRKLSFDDDDDDIDNDDNNDFGYENVKKIKIDSQPSLSYNKKRKLSESSDDSEDHIFKKSKQ